MSADMPHACAHAFIKGCKTLKSVVGLRARISDRVPRARAQTIVTPPGTRQLVNKPADEKKTSLGTAQAAQNPGQ